MKKQSKNKRNEKNPKHIKTKIKNIANKKCKTKQIKRKIKKK